MKQIDLHIHSNYSDGSDNPEDIVKKAHDKQLDLIALTDHNTIDGIDEFKQACIKYHQNALAGIEVSTNYQGQEIHLLGYFNLENDSFESLSKLINAYQNIKITQNEAILNKLKKQFPDISISEFYNFCKGIAKKQNLNRVHIAKYMVAKGIVSDISGAFNNYIDEKGPFFVSKKPISLYEAIKVVHESKGIAVIAHLGEYHFSVDEKKVFIKDCLDHGIDGFECYHPLNQIEDINLLTGCQQQNPALILTAGSDYHGTNKKNNFLGISYALNLLPEQKEQFDQITTNAYNFLLNYSKK